MIKKTWTIILPVIFTGTFLFAQPANNYQAVVKIVFNSQPISAEVEKAALKYNKEFAYSFTFDDGKADAYTNVYPLFSGGFIAEKNLLLPGLAYSDGCGNAVNFKGGLAINSVNASGFDPHEGTPGSITWEQVKELYTKGWNVFNHSYSHSHGAGTNHAYEITENTKYIKHKTGINTTHFVVPSGDSMYVQEAFNQNLKAVYNQQFNFPGAQGISVDGPVNLHQFKLFRRFISDEHFNDNNLREKIDEIAAQSSSTNHLWFTDFTHNVSFEPTGGSILFSTFQSYMNYIENVYGIKGSDRIWMAPLQEVYEYLLVREKIQYTSELKEDTLILYLDFKNVPEDLNLYSLTFNVDGPEFSDIVTENIESYSFNGTGINKILNITWKKVSVTSNFPMNKNSGICDLNQYHIINNPGHPELKINVNEDARGYVDVFIYNNIGTAIARKRFFPYSKNEQIRLESIHPNLAPGIYFIKILWERSDCVYEKKIIIY